MKKLLKHQLNYGETFPYVQSSLEEVNILSSVILKSVNFAGGHFFTLLTEGSNLERLYEFKEGVILPQNPRIQNGNSCYSIIPNIEKELSTLIHQKINSQTGVKAVFDDAIRNTQDFMKQSAKKNSEDLFFESITKFLGKELYYIVDANSCSPSIISQCLRESHAFWHSLLVLTTARLEHLQKRELSLEDITETCANVELIIICAYDGEGYILWEKNEEFFL